MADAVLEHLEFQRSEHAVRLRGIAQSGSAPALGAGCREFESLYPDHFNGGCSSVGRAPDCDSGCRGFDPRQPPHSLYVFDNLLRGIYAAFAGHEPLFVTGTTTIVYHTAGLTFHPGGLRPCCSYSGSLPGTPEADFEKRRGLGSTSRQERCLGRVGQVPEKYEVSVDGVKAQD